VTRGLAWLLGPELFWLLACGATLLLCRLNLPPSETGNAWLERLAWMLPLAAIPAAFLWSFGLMAPEQSRAWMSARLVFATLVGLNLCLFRIAGSIDYKDSRNSGLLGVWVYGVLAGLAAFAVCAMAVGYLAWKGRA